MESFKHLALEGMPLVALAQQEANIMGQIVPMTPQAAPAKRSVS
jgi:hypothetical protein